MKSKPLRVGVAGLGHLGSLHAKMLASSDCASLTAVYDLDEDKKAAIAAEHGAAAAMSLDDLFEAVDAVSIATPTSTHFEIACAAIEKGLHVFIEKPITATVEQASSLNEKAAAGGVTVQVGHIERFNPALVALDSYNLSPIFIESHRLAPFNPRGTDVPVVLDLMIHDIDIILSIVGNPVTHIDASGVAVVSDTVDIANARLKFEGGCVANITASRISQSRMRKMRMFQRNAYISVDFLAGSAEAFRLVDASDASVSTTSMLGRIEEGAARRTIVYEQPSIPEGHNPLKYELELFIKSVLEGRPPVVDGHAGQRALEVAERILALITASTP